MILKVYIKDKMLEMILQSQRVKIYVILFDIMNSSITRLYCFALPPAISEIVGFPTALLTECCQILGNRGEKRCLDIVLF